MQRENAFGITLLTFSTKEDSFLNFQHISVVQTGTDLIGRRLLRLIEVPPVRPRKGSVPLVPDGDAVTSADLLVVLAECGGPGYHPAGKTRPTVPVSETGQRTAKAEVVAVSGDDETPTYHLIDLHQAVHQPEPRPPVLPRRDVAQVSVVSVQVGVVR